MGLLTRLFEWFQKGPPLNGAAHEVAWYAFIPNFILLAASNMDPAQKKAQEKKEKRRRASQKYQSEIDDEIQKLMCFLPPPADGKPRVLSRNQILKGAYELAVKLKAEDKEAEERAKKPDDKKDQKLDDEKDEKKDERKDEEQEKDEDAEMDEDMDMYNQPSTSSNY